MAGLILDGEALADKIKAGLAEEVEALKKAGRPAHLVAVQVGDPPASRIYVNQQKKACESIGLIYDLNQLDENCSEQDVLDEIKKLNEDDSVSGIILQMPLGPGMDARKVQITIDPDKDVEGMHPVNMGRLFYGGGKIVPCTPSGAVELLKSTGIDLAGKEAVVVGHSEIVGKPIAAILLQSLNASPTVTVCHIATKDLAAHTRRAEILFVGTGKAQAVWQRYNRMKKAGEEPPIPDLSPLIKADMIKDGAIVIDVAINRLPKALDADGECVKNEKGKNAMVTVGDVDFDGAKDKCGWITPVPGGCGPMTVAMLLKNTVEAAKAAAGI
ncbi:MAG: bifunctional 5,10-methylenetetrahydrofolate dehydrogenase/5,10-methenyltetrahydrofolate cyclohydrolase [Phycisphaerae bacterium]|nr:bifunctional 5,10-methylenetetrahydrofolate dehydrogenase/5,10-methenyltetrahydrofolate cyclohydrolase [Phycisphaerae bacterium]